MPEELNLDSDFGQILQGKAPAAAAGSPESTGVPGLNLDSDFGRFLQNPVGSTLDSELQRGSSWDEASSRLKQLGADPEQFKDKKQFFDLANKRKELESRGMSLSQSWRSTYQPFGSLVTVPESLVRPLDYASREIGRLGGKEQDIGGRVVGNSEYQQATQRFAQGKATQDDIEAIATYERHAQIRASIAKGANFGQKFALEVGGIGTLSAETMAGTRILSGAARIAIPARPAVAAIAGVAPAVPTAAVQGLGTRALNLGISTAVTPSMYIPAMQQANMRARRGANNFRGLPTAFGYAYANMLVLGKMSGGRIPESTILGNAFRKGVLGVAEMQTVDAAAGVVDQFLPKAYQIKPDDERWGNIGSFIRAYRAGDRDKASEVLRDATIQALAFGSFAAIHGREGHADDLMQSYADTYAKLRKSGMDKTRSGEVIGELHVKLEDALSADPYLSREKARELLKTGVPEPLKDYADKLADTFEPQSKLPTPTEVKESMPAAPTDKPAEAVAAAATPEPSRPGESAPKLPFSPGDRVQDPSRPAGDLSTVSSVDPTEPNPNRRVTLEHTDGTTTNTSVESVTPRTPVDPVVAKPIVPTVAATGKAPAAWERAIDLERRADELEAKITEVAAARKIAERLAKSGVNPKYANEIKRQHKQLRDEHKSVLKELETVQAQADAEAAATWQPITTAATVSKPSSVAPEATKVQPTNTPAEPVSPGSRTPQEAAAGVWKYDGMRTPDTRQDQLSEHMSNSAYSLAKRMGRGEEEARQIARQVYQDNAFGASDAPVKPKPPEEPDVHTVTTLTKKLHYLVDTSEGLSGPMRAYFKSSVAQVTTRLPAAAVARIGENLKNAKFYRSPLDAAKAHTQERLLDPDLTDAERMKWEAHLAKFEQGVHSAVGAFNEKTGTLYIDGAALVGREPGVHGYEGTLEASQIAGHEMGHNIDGPNKEYSSDPRFTSAYLAEIGSAKHKAMANPPLTKYATASRAEGFAEFCRLLYATDVPTSRIESEFPKTSKFFKERNLWPEERKGEAEPIKEVFNERIGDEKSHVDAKNESTPEHSPPELIPEPAAAATPEPVKKARKPRAGERVAKEREHGVAVGKLVPGGHNPEYYEALKGVTSGTPVIVMSRPIVRLTSEGPQVVKKGTVSVAAVGEGGRPIASEKPAAVEPEPAADWRRLDAMGADDPLADKRVLGQFVEKYKSDPEVSKYLEDVRHNIPSDVTDLHGKDRRYKTITALDAAIANAESNGDTKAVSVLKDVVGHFGGKLIDTVGETVPYRPGEMETKRGAGNAVPIDAGTPVVVKRQGIQVYDDGKYNRQNIADNAEGMWLTPVKSVVEPAKAAAAALPKAGAAKKAKPEPTPEELKKFYKEQWDSMDSDEKRAIRADPVQRKIFEENGIDVMAKEKTGKMGVKGHAVEGLDQHIEDVKANDKLSAGERIVMIRTLQGKGQRDIGRELGGVSHTSIQKYVRSALEKMRKFSTNWEDFKTAQDVIDAGVKEGERLRLAAANDYRRTQQDKESDGEPGIQELRIKSIASAFGPDARGRTIRQRLSELLFGNLPDSARAAKDQEIDGQIAAYAFDVKNAADDLRSALRSEYKPYEQLSASELKALDRVLRTKPTSPDYAAVRSGIGTKTLAALDTMRSQVDKLSTKLIDIGAIDGPLVAAVEAAKGEYLTRQFRVFTDPLWFKNVDKSVVNRFKSWLAAQLIAAGHAPTPEQVDSITKSLLVNGTAAENPIAFLKKSQLGSKDLSILKARKDIPEELRALWGEYEDPLINYSNSVAKMAHLATAHSFLKRVAREGLGKFFFTEPTENKDGQFFHEISSEDNPAMQPLSGLRTTLEIKKAFEEVFTKGQTGWAMQWYMKALAAAKFNKVILSHVGQIHNFMSNVLIAVRNGHFNVTKAPAAVVDIFNNTEKGREYWRKLITLGVVGEGIHYNDFQNTVKDAMGGRDHFAGIDTGVSHVANTMLGRMLRTAAKRAALVYNYGDAVWKVYGFENEKAKYQAAGFSESAAEAKAAEIVRDTMPTYSKIAPGLQALRKSPLVAPFIAFQAEMLRTTKNNLLLAVKEMRDPATRSIGVKRFAGMAAAATLPSAIAAASAAMFGVDQSEEKALRRFLPDWQKNSTLVYFGRDPKTGHPRYTDLSRIDPHAYFSDGVIGFLRGKDSAEGVKNAVAEWAKPFTQEELLVRPAIDVARNAKEPGGQVYNPQAGTLQQAGDISSHVGQAFTPAAYGPIRRMAKALAGSSEQKSGKEYNVPDTAVEQAGVRIEAPRVREDLANKALGFERAKKDADKMVQDMIHAKGDVSPQELKTARDATEAARKRTMDEFRLDVEAAERLGVPRKEIAMILKTSGLSVAEIGQLFSATQAPYFPALKGSATERARAGQVRRLAAPSGQP